MENGTLEVPVEKIKDIRDILTIILDNRSSISARRLSSIVGKIIALKPSFGNICQLMTRHLSITICGKESWDSALCLDSENVQELKFWLENINSISFKYFTCVEKMPEKIIFSDASCYAGAGFTCERNEKIVHYMWDDFEKHKSSTWRELKTVQVILLSLAEELSGRLVKLFTDN